MTEIWVNIGSGNGLLPDGTWRHQAFTWTNVDLPSVRSIGIHLSTILQVIPGANELRQGYLITY